MHDPWRRLHRQRRVEAAAQLLDARQLTRFRRLPLLPPAPHLAAKKAIGVPKAGEADLVGVDGVQLQQGLDEGRRHRAPRFDRVGKLGGQRVADDVAVDPLHHVEPRADHRFVLAERDHLRHGNPGAPQGREHPVLARHVVRRGKHMRGRGTADDEAAPCVFHDVGEIRAAAGDHLTAQRAIEPSDPRSQVTLERIEVEPGRRGHCGGGCP